MLHILFAILISIGSFNFSPKVFGEDQRQNEYTQKVQILADVSEDLEAF